MLPTSSNFVEHLRELCIISNQRMKYYYIGTIATIEPQKIGPPNDLEDSMNGLPMKEKADYFLQQRSIE